MAVAHLIGSIEAMNVLRDILGYDDAQIERLRHKQILA